MERPRLLDGNRVWEIDFLRGLAIILMVIYHTAFNLKVFYGLPVPYDHILVYYLTKFFAGLFILLSGISCTFSRNNLRRGLELILLALGVTVTTFLVVPGSNIIFGILHLLGVSILLFPLMRRLPPFLLIALGAAVIAGGFALPHVVVHHDWPAPLGLYSASFFSADYFPLIPWWGVFLIGNALGPLLYPQKRSLLTRALSDNIINRTGRYTLAVYLLHQPLIMGILWLLLGPVRHGLT